MILLFGSQFNIMLHPNPFYITTILRIYVPVYEPSLALCSGKLWSRMARTL